MELYKLFSNNYLYNFRLIIKNAAVLYMYFIGVQIKISFDLVTKGLGRRR